MELLYLWIEDYKNIKQQGFNFSPLYDFHFEPTFDESDTKKDKIIGGTLTDKMKPTEKENKEKFYEDFFNSKEDKRYGSVGVNSVTAIVGENGVGKSAILEVLMNKSLSINYVAIFETKILGSIIGQGIIKRYVCYHSKLNNIKSQIEYLNLEFVTNTKAFRTGIFYYDNLPFSFQPYGIDTGERRNLSTSYLLEKEENLEVGDIKRQGIFLKEELQLDFLKKISEKDIVLEIRVNAFDSQLYEKFSKNMYDSIRISYLYQYCKYHGRIPSSKVEFDEILELDSLEEMEKVAKSKKVFLSYSNNSEDFDGNYNIDLILATLKKYCSYEDSESCFYIPLRDSNIFLSLISLPFSIFHLEWTIASTPFKSSKYTFSSGEINLLNLFSRLYNYVVNPRRQYERDENNDVLLGFTLLIDEGELGLHPQWQKQYLKILLDTLPKIFPNKQIQLILTSHSPFLVSDLPKENVIFLEKEKDTGLCKVSKLESMKETFGANIHTLLTDSFFMKGGLVGEFAQSKIDKAIDILNESAPKKEDLDTCEMIISMIGEPIVKTMLQKLLDSKRLRKVDKHSTEIEELKARIHSLESILKNDNPI